MPGRILKACLLSCLFQIMRGSIISGPVNHTVLLGHTAEFQCQYNTTSDQEWMVNGTTLNSTDGGIMINKFTEELGNGRLRSRLQVQAFPHGHNNTEITCVVGNQSESAFFTIQGLLLYYQLYKIMCTVELTCE